MQSYSSPNALGADGATPFNYPNNNQQHNHSEQSPTDEELQLTAQLTRGLGPNMNTGSGGAMTDGQDGQNHGGIQQQQHYGQEGHHTPALQANHSPMDQMGNQYLTPDDQSAPRKRSKVSRACDECRRKKVKCDAAEEGGAEYCTGCKRVGMACKFSRVPMKRGPSKGYIKELADRLHTLERSIPSGGETPSANYNGQPETLPHRESDEFSPDPNGNSTQRKRTYSNLSANFDPSYRQGGGFAQQEGSRQVQTSSVFATQQSIHGQATFREPNYDQNGLPPSPQWNKAPETAGQQNSFDALQSIDYNKSELHSSWDEEVVATYYTLIHPNYPILPHAKDRLSTALSACPNIFKEAFHESLYVAVQAFQPSIDQTSAQQSLKRASQLVVALQYENDAPSSISTSIIYLQATMLLAIASETLALRGKTASSRSFWLSSAVSLAYDSKLHQYKGQDSSIANDVDADENVSRRIWWILVIMERWHAASAASPPQIPELSLVIRPEDQQILGDSFYHLARLSIILGHFSMAHITSKDLPPLGVPVNQLLTDVLRGELERWRETVPGSVFQTIPFVLMCYWHVRIFLELRLPESDPSELLEAAKNITTCVPESLILYTPLTYYTTSLAALVLVDLTSYEEGTKEVAEEALNSLLKAHSVPPALESTLRAKRQPQYGSGATNRTESINMTASMSLQHLADLADLASATDGGNEVITDLRIESKQSENRPLSGHLDLREAVKTGYLNLLSSETSR